MLILAKSILGLMLGFFVSVIFGYFLIPVLRKLKCGQTISAFTAFRHASKQGTPTIGGLIFIVPTLITMLFLYLRGSLQITSSLLIILFVFISYALLGFVDDFLKIKAKNNDGLSITQKLIIQVLIALIFFFIYMKGGADTYLRITSLGINVDLKWFYGIFILFLLVGSLLGFLVYNTHPAKVFMGDTGSLALGASLAAIAILSKHELSLAVIGGVFVIEALSSIIQLTAIKKFHKKVFLMAPIHHHFEKLGWEETDIVKMFLIVGFMLGMIAIYYGVWM